MLLCSKIYDDVARKVSVLMCAAFVFHVIEENVLGKNNRFFMTSVVQKKFYLLENICFVHEILSLAEMLTKYRTRNRMFHCTTSITYGMSYAYLKIIIKEYNLPTGMTSIHKILLFALLPFELNSLQ